MAELSFQSPLEWPAYLPETPLVAQRMDHGFPPGVQLDDAIQFLKEECLSINPQRAILTTDVDNLSIERTRKRIGSRTGVNLMMKIDMIVYNFACDRWQLLEHNIYAIHLHLRGLRSAEKLGVGTLAMAFAGYQEPKAVKQETVKHDDLPEWMDALGLGPSATLEDAIAVYHRRARLYAQDAAGLTKLNGLMEKARKALKVG